MSTVSTELSLSKSMCAHKNSKNTGDIAYPQHGESGAEVILVHAPVTAYPRKHTHIAAILKLVQVVLKKRRM
jgi:hypothetical protein